MYCYMYCCFLSSYRNTSGRLGERENAVGTQATRKFFHSFFEFSQTANVSIKQLHYELNISIV